MVWFPTVYRTGDRLYRRRCNRIAGDIMKSRLFLISACVAWVAAMSWNTAAFAHHRDWHQGGGGGYKAKPKMKYQNQRRGGGPPPWAPAHGYRAKHKYYSAGRYQEVAPADLGGGSTLKLPMEITIDIEIDLEEKYGLGAGGDYTGTAYIGEVKVKGGRVTFNGQPLGNPEQQAIAAACRETYKK